MLGNDNDDVYCPLLNRKIEWGYCWELCNIATNDILLEGDKIEDWKSAQRVCEKCGRYKE